MNKKTEINKSAETLGTEQMQCSWNVSFVKPEQNNLSVHEEWIIFKKSSGI